MKRLLFLVALLAALVIAAGGRAEGGSAKQYYVALGDSLAEGYQPNGNLAHGYVDKLYAARANHDRHRRQRRLAVTNVRQILADVRAAAPGVPPRPCTCAPGHGSARSTTCTRTPPATP